MTTVELTKNKGAVSGYCPLDASQLVPTANLPGGGGGEANSASNVGAGQGVFKSKVGIDLQFRSLTATSSKIALANNTNDVGIDVTEANLTLSNMTGPLSVAKGGTGVATLTGIPVASGTSNFTAVTAPAGTIVGTTDTQTLTGKTMDALTNTFPNHYVSCASKKWSAWQPFSSTLTQGTAGFFNGNLVLIQVGTGASGAFGISSIGARQGFTTGTTINSIGGVRCNSVLTMERDLNPLLRGKIQWPTAVTTMRAFFGFTSATAIPASTADYLANLSGVGFWYDSAVDGNIHIMQNNGAASSDITTIANVAAAGTTQRTFALRADNANTKFEYSYEGGAWTTVNTAIPAASTALGWTCHIECLAGTAARALNIYYVEAFQDP